MLCPYCANDKTRVIGTVKGGTKVERFRKCEHCGKTFMTTEAIKFDDYWREYAKETSEQLAEEQADRSKER